LNVEHARTEIEARAIEANDAQDKRISEFHNRRIELDNAENHRRFVLTNRIFLGVFVVVAIPLGLLIYMVFWGDEVQREHAITILTTGGIAVGGYGVTTAFAGAVKGLLRRPRLR